MMGAEPIGIVGLGRMGRAIARNLLRNDRRVIGFDVDPEAAASLADTGFEEVTGVAEVAHSCRVVITSLVTAAQLSAVLDEIGCAAADRDVPLVVDASTMSPEASRLAAQGFEERGGRLLCAPVSGSTELAAAGRLVVICSGAPEDFEQAAPILELLASKVEYVGQGEIARVAKLAVNLVVLGTMELLGEAVGLAEALGLGRAETMRLINESVIGSHFTRYKTSAIIERDYSPTASVALARKDLSLMLGLADDIRLQLPVTRAVDRQYGVAEQDGDGKSDIAAVIATTETARHGVRPR